MSSENSQVCQWRDLELPLKELASRLKTALIHHESETWFHIQYYFCQSVMELATFLRTHTKASELGAQHHTLKILFKFLEFGDEGVLEYPFQNGRVDIFVQHANRVIEVKTITQMTLEKLFSKILGVITTENLPADQLWVFYFYKLQTPSPLNHACQYLLTFISLDLLELDKESLRWMVSRMVEESKVHVAEKLRVRPEIIIPLENLIKVEDLERELVQKDDKFLQVIKQKDHILSEKDQQLKEKEQQLKEKDQQLKEKEQQLKEKDQENVILKNELQKLKKAI